MTLYRTVPDRRGIRATVSWVRLMHSSTDAQGLQQKRVRAVNGGSCFAMKKHRGEEKLRSPWRSPPHSPPTTFILYLSQAAVS